MKNSTLFVTATVMLLAAPQAMARDNFRGYRPGFRSKSQDPGII